MSAVVKQQALGRAWALAELAREIGAARVVGDESLGVVGVRQDSRKIEPGDLFVVRRGQATDGALYVDEALRRGAVALLVERGTEAFTRGVPCIEADDIRLAIARASAAVYGNPSFALKVVGITGTNGKTTTSFLAKAAIDGAGERAGLMGTLGYRFGDIDVEASHTTPEADDFARLAASMRREGATHLVTEVSSHALAQARVDAVRFRVAAFTNLTQDHLDFHETMEAYSAAKSRLFLDLAPGAAAICIDDPVGLDLAKRVRSPLLRVSQELFAHAEIAPVWLSSETDRTRARIATPSGEVEIDSPLVGAHNLSNLLLALGITSALELDVHAAAEALSRTTVPGRLERCDGPGDDLLVLVDYAHTPDALERVLGTVRKLTSGRLICVFGCGGDRDRDKRPLMGAAVLRGADLAIVTSDNPRTEDPRAIADAVLEGMSGRSDIEVELDRALAIERAVAMANAGDVVLIAGKGHETYQIVGRERRVFDDREVARLALARRRISRGGEA